MQRMMALPMELGSPTLRPVAELEPEMEVDLGLKLKCESLELVRIWNSSP